MKVTTFVCDRCKRPIPRPYSSVSLTVNESDSVFDLCPECEKNFSRFLSNLPVESSSYTSKPE